MSTSAIRRLFFVGALFNWAIATVFVVDVNWLLQLFQVTPLSTEPVFLYLLAAVVFAFGIGYYWVSRDPIANVPIIRLGIVGKLCVAAMALILTVFGEASWQLNLLSGADLAFAVLFIAALKALGSA